MILMRESGGRYFHTGKKKKFDERMLENLKKNTRCGGCGEILCVVVVRAQQCFVFQLT